MTKPSSASALSFHAPPIWEVGLAAFSAEPGVIDPYDVRSVHDRFRHTFPIAERQHPVMQFETAPMIGGPNAALDEGVGVPPRWWFICEDRSELLQLQERFWSWNWRRQDSAPGSPVAYPGFDAIKAKAQASIDELKNHGELIGKPFPNPGVCELLYDNVIPLSPDNGSFRLADLLTEYTACPPKTKAGWQMAWHEPLGDATGPEVARILIVLGGMVSPDATDVVQIAKMAFNVGSLVSSWDEAFDFYEKAHRFVRKRFLELTTDKAHTMWGMT